MPKQSNGLIFCSWSVLICFLLPVRANGRGVSFEMLRKAEKQVLDNTLVLGIVKSWIRLFLGIVAEEGFSN